MAGTPEDQDREASEQDRFCKKCGGHMQAGKAIAQTLTGMPDFPGDRSAVTLSAGGPGVLIDCLKCGTCGWSITVPTLPFNAAMTGPAGVHVHEPVGQKPRTEGDK